MTPEIAPELSLAGMYAEYLEKPKPEAVGDPGLTVPERYAASRELFLLETNVGTEVTREEFVFLYKSVLITIMDQLRTRNEPQDSGDIETMKVALVQLMPALIRTNAQTLLEAGEIDEDLASTSLSAAEFWEQDATFAGMIVESCLNDARIKTIQAEVADSTGIQLPQAMA